MPKDRYVCEFCSYRAVVPSMIEYHECAVHQLCPDPEDEVD